MASLPSLMAAGALSGACALAASLARCSWQRARLALEDSRQLSRDGGPDAAWLGAAAADAAMGMASPGTVSELCRRGLVGPGAGSARWRLRTRSGHAAWPWWLALSCLACCLAAGLSGSPLAAPSCAFACASACLDWAHRTVSPALCVGWLACALAAWGGPDAACLAVGAALALASAAATLATGGRSAGSGDALLAGAWAASMPSVAGLVAACAALSVVAAACRLRMGARARVPLACLLVGPWILGVVPW